MTALVAAPQEVAEDPKTHDKNERGIRTPRGSEWQAVQVKRVLERV